MSADKIIIESHIIDALNGRDSLDVAEVEIEVHGLETVPTKVALEDGSVWNLYEYRDGVMCYGQNF